ncbi:hypothetical protein ABZZ48_10495, partial [Kitasatospora indigofera]
VVRVNYRGSTGYGQAWTDALRERVGLIELDPRLPRRSPPAGRRRGRHRAGTGPEPGGGWPAGRSDGTAPGPEKP